jgi:signal transduction histidine kinase
MAPPRPLLYVVAVLGGLGVVAAVIWTVLVGDDPLGSLTWTAILLPLFVTAVWLLRRRPDHIQTWRLLVLASSLCVSQGLEGPVELLDRSSGSGGWFVASWVGVQVLGQTCVVTSAVLIATYPDGVVEQRWQRIAVDVIRSGLALPLIVLLVRPTLLPDGYLLEASHPPVASPLFVPAMSWLAPPIELVQQNYLIVPVGVAIAIARYARADPARRGRMRLLIYSMAATAGVLCVDLAVRIRWGQASAATQALDLVASLGTLMIPFSIVVGVLRYRLFDIDLVLRRSVVYGLLWLGIAALYTVAATAPGIALGNGLSVQLAVAVTFVTAVSFQWLLRRLERLADRWIFGGRVDRYQLVTSFGAAMERAADLGELLPGLADTIHRGLGAAWVRIRLQDTEPGRWLESPQVVIGDVCEPATLVQDLRRADVVLGRIECGPRPSGYDDLDRELLASLAGQSATAIANVRLTGQLAERLEELTRSRARIVTAQDAERRRIERDIHDGAQQSVVALLAGLRLARNRLGRSQLADADLATLQEEAGNLLTDLRELAQGIHPPVLSDNGLVAAVESRAGRLPLEVSVIADAAVRARQLPVEVEGAAYFVICEALTNVAKHARASTAVVELTSSDGQLALQVRDDGTGLAPSSRPGTGLTNLRDRIEALGGRLDVSSVNGGGTRVAAHLPWAVSHA